MTIKATITTALDTDDRGCPILYIGATRVLVGDYLGTYDEDADEDTGYPTTLADGRSSIDDDRDRDELRDTLAAFGLDTVTDDVGIVLVLR